MDRLNCVEVRTAGVVRLSLVGGVWDSAASAPSMESLESWLMVASNRIKVWDKAKWDFEEKFPKDLTFDDAARHILFKLRWLITGTGKARIFIAAGITEDEWELGKSTTTAHVLLLLCRAGVGKRTDSGCQSVLNDPRWRAEWKQIARLEGEEARAEVEAQSP